MSNSGKYRDLLNKINNLSIGGGRFWRPDEGRNVIRILPEVGSMEYFFVEAGKHYVDGDSYICSAAVTDGREPCPCCDANEILYRNGEKDLASKFRYSRKFYMNVIVRGQESQGPLIYSPGVTIFGAIATVISDPDYGDITDVENGTDIVINREGTGLDTEYQTTPRRSITPLSDDMEEAADWLESAEDLRVWLEGQIQDYDEMADATGASAFLDLDTNAAGNVGDEELSPTERIQRRLNRRR